MVKKIGTIKKISADNFQVSYTENSTVSVRKTELNSQIKAIRKAIRKAEEDAGINKMNAELADLTSLLVQVKKAK